MKPKMETMEVEKYLIMEVVKGNDFKKGPQRKIRVTPTMARENLFQKKEKICR